ncbi:MAG: very short patch repair endonuclease [Pirellulales bacterium]
MQSLLCSLNASQGTSETLLSRIVQDEVRKADQQLTTFGGLSRSALMARVRSHSNLTTELRLVHFLRTAGISGWRRHFPVLGCPDFCWPKERIAVFVHGCFWHGHNCGRNLVPRSNRKFWVSKIKGNQKRDTRISRSLRKHGWTVITIWECILTKSPQYCVRRIARYLSLKRKPL